MTVVVDLFRDAQHRSSEGHVYSTDVARFTEASEGSRVLADSQCYITYSTKKGDTLRVVQRSDLAKGSMRGHTSAIHAVRFVNYRSNVAASASCGEFFVWLVTSGADGSNGMPQAEPSLAINIYFRLVERVTVRCFSFFINAENKRPDVLLLYENEAAILQSSALIARYSNTPLMATLRENSKTLRPIQAGVTKDALCSVGSGGWFAFTVEPTMIVACTLQNRSTPPWSCCGGAPVRGLHLLDTPQVEGTTTLVACCDRVVYQWSLSGVSEPTLARKFVVDGSVVALESSRGSFAVFNCKQGVAVVQVQSVEKFACSWYALPWQISRGGVSFNRVGEDYYLLADCKDRITITQLKKADSGKKEDCALQQEREQSSPSGVKGVKTGTTPGGTATSIKIKSDPSKPTVGSLIASLANHLGIRPDVGADGTPPASETLSPAATVNAASAAGSTNTAQRGGSYGHSGGRPVTAGLGSAGSTRLPAPASSIAANEPTGGSGGGLRTAIGDEKETAFTGWGSGNPSAAASASVSAPAQSARLALHNASLPQAPTDGVLAAVVQQAQEDVQQELGRLESAMENTLKVLELAPETIQRAHEQLLNLSLEAQMTELQQQDSSGSANYSSFESNVLTSFGDPLAKGIADSVTRGVDDALNAYLEYSVRQALVNCARGTQKHAVKARLDEALKESTAQFVAQVERTVRNVVDGELPEVFVSINGLLMTLVNDNIRLQKELESILATDVVAELKKTREELQVLREKVLNQPTTGFACASQASRPAPEAVLSTTQELIQQQQYGQGLEYVLMANQPQLVLHLFAVLSQSQESAYSKLIEDVATPNSIWCRVVTQLIAAPTTSEEKDMAVGILIDILSEREQLLQKTGPSARVADSLRTFVRDAKAEGPCSSSMRSLKNLEKLLP